MGKHRSIWDSDKKSKKRSEKCKKKCEKESKKKCEKKCRRRRRHHRRTPTSTTNIPIIQVLNLSSPMPGPQPPPIPPGGIIPFNSTASTGLQISDPDFFSYSPGGGTITILRDGLYKVYFLGNFSSFNSVIAIAISGTAVSSSIPSTFFSQEVGTQISGELLVNASANQTIQLINATLGENIVYSTLGLTTGGRINAEIIIERVGDKTSC